MPNPDWTSAQRSLSAVSVCVRVRALSVRACVAGGGIRVDSADY